MAELKTGFKLQLQYNPDLLKDDLEICLTDYPVSGSWGSHYNKKDYEGDWNSIALYSASGNTSDILALPAERFTETPLLAKCPYFKELLDALLFEKEAVRLLRLAPGSTIHPHRDNGLAYRFGCFRLHVPIITAGEVEFIVGGEHLAMHPGECWYADFDQLHAVYNKSGSERIHLVIDGKRNAWTDELFSRSGFGVEEEDRRLRPDAATIEKICAELQRSGNPDAGALIAALKQQLL